MNSIYIELFTLLNNMKQNIEEKKISNNIYNLQNLYQTLKWNFLMTIGLELNYPYMEEMIGVD